MYKHLSILMFLIQVRTVHGKPGKNIEYLEK